MSYEPTVWKDGDLVTSAKLNKMEQGIARNDVVEGITENGVITLNKTWQEIWDNNYTNIVIVDTDKASNPFKKFVSIRTLTSIDPLGICFVSIDPPFEGSSATNFTCSSPDGYPSYDESSDSTNK